MIWIALALFTPCRILTAGEFFKRGHLRKYFIKYIPAEYDWYGKDRN